MKLRSKAIVSKCLGSLLLLGGVFLLTSCNETSYTVAPKHQTIESPAPSNQVSQATTVEESSPQANQIPRVKPVEAYYNNNQSNWVRVRATRNNDVEASVDLNSIRSHENLVTYYARFMQSTIDENGIKAILSRYVMNCRLGAYQVIEMAGLDEQGKIILYTDTVESVKSIQSGTVGEFLYRTACQQNAAYLSNEMIRQRQEQAISEELLRFYIQDIESNRRFLSSFSNTINYGGNYEGPCQYPSNLDSRDYRCGRRAASERPGGYE